MVYRTRVIEEWNGTGSRWTLPKTPGCCIMNAASVPL